MGLGNIAWNAFGKILGGEKANRAIGDSISEAAQGKANQAAEASLGDALEDTKNLLDDYAERQEKLRADKAEWIPKFQQKIAEIMEMDDEYTAKNAIFNLAMDLNTHEIDFAEVDETLPPLASSACEETLMLRWNEKHNSFYADLAEKAEEK